MDEHLMGWGVGGSILKEGAPGLNTEGGHGWPVRSVKTFQADKMG